MAESRDRHSRRQKRHALCRFAAEESDLPPPGFSFSSSALSSVAFPAASPGASLLLSGLFPAAGDSASEARESFCLSGEEITVAFDRPTALQIDGETVTGVTEYGVMADADSTDQSVAV